MLRVVGNAIAMHGLLWPDEVRAPEGVAPDVDVTVRDKELDLADALMDTLGEVDLEDLHDEYRVALEEVIAAKAAGEELPEAPAPAPGGKVLDLMAALEKSVRAAKESRGEEVAGEAEEAAEAGAEVTPLPRRRTTRAAPKETGGKKTTAAAKKTAAPASKSKSAAKKTTAKQTTAKKTTAKKTAAKKATKAAEKKATPRKRTA
jgi:DNA end-binding protein Ku